MRELDLPMCSIWKPTGQGTNLGDSIELRALSAVYGQERDPERPLLIGSVKGNVGHLEWASGMAGLIKVVLAMAKRVIPAPNSFRDPQSGRELGKVAGTDCDRG